MNNFDRYKPNLIYLCSTGSRAHGLERPDSDYDIKGVYLAPTEELLGFTEPPQSFRRLDEKGGKKRDFTVYELGKFVRMALSGDVPALEMLWAPDNMQMSVFKPFIEHRDKFLSRRLIARYHGYASGQRCTVQESIHGGRDAKWKSAAAMIRLLWAGTTATATRAIPVRVEDQEMKKLLRSILLGLMPIGEVMELHDKLVNAFHLVEQTTDLPDNPDEAFIEALLQGVRRTRLQVWEPCEWKV